MAQPQLLTPQAAARARQLELFARTRVEGFLKGPNASPLKGQSSDFLRHRQYQPGDDIRHLDWRVFGRSERLVIRQYEEFTNLELCLVIDCSGSMGYVGDSVGKLDFAIHAAAMLAYLFNLQKDHYGLAQLSDHIVDARKPSSGRRHLAEAFRWLAAIEPAGETDLAACTQVLLRQTRRRSIFVVFSDCYQDPRALSKALGTLCLKGHDVLLFQVYHPDEHDLDFTGFTLFRDLETGEIDAADPLEIRQAYQEVVHEHQAHLQAGCNRFGIDLHALAAGADYDAALAHALRLRNQRL